MSDVRNTLRSQILAVKPTETRVVDFFGAKIEIRQPTLGAILDVKDEENQHGAMIRTLMMYAFVPGTNELVFEEGDIETLKTMPFGADFMNVSKAMEELSSINFREPGKSLETTDSSGGDTESPGN